MEKWRIEQRRGFNSLVEIAEFLDLCEIERKQLLDRKDFPLHLPMRIAEKIPKGCLDNALAKQFLPINLELDGEGDIDPVGDVDAMKSKALLHKYEGRALLLTTGACAMHCRYCFRQNFSYKSELDKAFTLIGNDSSIKEVILSGGDPLSLSDKALKELFLRLEEISHVEIIRFHSRFLIGIPERVTKRFLELLKASKKQVIFVQHVNCIEELDDDIIEALSKIQELKIPVLTQSVLLKGVNDSKKALYDLFLKLASVGVIPYYLHQFDRVKGGMHFEVSKEKGILLMKSLRDSLPGYAVPTYVEEIKGRTSKTIIPLHP